MLRGLILPILNAFLKRTCSHIAPAVFPDELALSERIQKRCMYMDMHICVCACMRCYVCIKMSVCVCVFMC